MNRSECRVAYRFRNMGWCWLISSPTDCWGVWVAWVCSFGDCSTVLNQAFGKLKRYSCSLVWCLGHLAVWRGTPAPCCSERLEYKFLTSSFFSCPVVYTFLPLSSVFWDMETMNTAIGYAGDACSTYLLPRSLWKFSGARSYLVITANVFSGARLTSAVSRRKVSLKIPSEEKRSWEN